MPEAEKEKAPKEKKEKPLNLCLSGTGNKCKGTFAPGGDAKFKRDLIHRITTGVEPTDSQKKEERARLKGLGYSDEYMEKFAPELVTIHRAEEILKERNWTHFLTRKRELITSKAKQAEQRAKEAKEKALEAAEEKARQKEKAAASA